MRPFAVFALLFALLASPAIAQNTIDYDVSVRRGVESLTTTITWAMVPAPPAGAPAEPCTATGAAQWAGPKAASGSETVTFSSSGSTSLNLTCNWPGDDRVTFNWTPATRNTDGSTFADRKDTVLAYTFSPTVNFASANDMICMLPSVTCVTVDDAANPRPTTRQITGITTVGTLRGRGYHVNSVGVWSDPSGEATKVFNGAASASDSIGVTIDPKPEALTDFTAE